MSDEHFLVRWSRRKSATEALSDDRAEPRSADDANDESISPAADTEPKQEPEATFDDLGNAVRRIRVDLGGPIEFLDGVQIFARDKSPAGAAGSYWALGRIKYSAVDSGADKPFIDGLLLYLKPAIYGREPSAITPYSRATAEFPPEPTSAQFFSESHFESYRAFVA